MTHRVALALLKIALFFEQCPSSTPDLTGTGTSISHRASRGFPQLMQGGNPVESIPWRELPAGRTTLRAVRRDMKLRIRARAAPASAPNQRLFTSCEPWYQGRWNHTLLRDAEPRAPNALSLVYAPTLQIHWPLNRGPSSDSTRWSEP